MPRSCQISRLTRLPDFPTPISPNGMFKIGMRVYFRRGFCNDEYTSGVVTSKSMQVDKDSHSYEVMIDFRKNEKFKADDYVKICVDERYLSVVDDSI